MGFAMPAERTDTATFLRDLEQNCAKTTPKEVRAALIRAAQELEQWQKLAEDTARQLTEAANVRISQMATTSAVDEVQRGVKSTMLDLAARFRELS
jgi:Lon protease-like protein